MDRSDIVLGFDQFFLLEARKMMKWQDVSDIYKDVQQPILPTGSATRDFFAFDWGALTFVYREGEVPPPTHLLSLIHI